MLSALGDEEVIARNVAEKIRPPCHTTTIFTLDEARRFLLSIRGRHGETLLLVSVFAGRGRASRSR